MASRADAQIEITESGPQTFELIVTIAGQRFACGSYLHRGAAQQAAALFIARKEAEDIGRKKRPRRT